ncbi:MAG: GMC family oxidoreductase N-terminal domain-containing protein, partial [Lautropia sp.]
MSRFPDPIAAGLDRGWQVIDASIAAIPPALTADVVIIGSGAGGGITAEVLARHGLRVLIVEEGPLRSSRDFRMREADAYPDLYQESLARKTADKAITILQGRCVGGSTTVNWTSSFRTPPATLAFWQQRHGLVEFDAARLTPWFDEVEARLGIADWPLPPNRNNDLLRLGAARLGIPAGAIRRNVRQCANLGYCGTGCPTNAKQSMLVTTLPAALDRGAALLTRTRAERFVWSGRRAAGLVLQPLAPDGLGRRGAPVTVRASHYVIAGGAINSPALLLRSALADPAGAIGARTFLHPTVVSAAIFADRVDGYAGAPQSVAVDHFLEADPIDGPLGFKLEAPPIHPLLFASTLHGFGRVHAERMQQFAHTHALIALLRDGFHPDSTGGRVRLAADGAARLSYPLDDLIFDGARRALIAMAEIQFAAGAKTVFPVDERLGGFERIDDARAALRALRLRPLLTRVLSAHVMGGCALDPDPARGVTAPDGSLHQADNVSVHDGSLFPTSIGANPQLSIYGIVARLAAGLASRLTGRPAARAFPADRFDAAAAATRASPAAPIQLRRTH